MLTDSVFDSDMGSVAYAVDFSAPLTSFMSAGTRSASTVLFETQLEAQVQLEFTRLITAWFASQNRTVGSFFPSQVALDNVQTKPVVRFDIVLLPASAASVSPADAAHAFVSAMEAAALAGTGALSNTSYPLLSLHTLKPVVGLDGFVIAPLTITVTSMPLLDTLADTPAPTAAAEPSASTSSTRRVLALSVLCGVLSLLLLSAVALGCTLRRQSKAAPVLIGAAEPSSCSGVEAEEQHTEAPTA